MVSYGRDMLLVTSSPLQAHETAKALRDRGFDAAPSQRGPSDSLVSVLCAETQHHEILEIARGIDADVRVSEF